MFDGPGEASEFSRPPAFESGAGGLASTADDYLAFCRMLLNGGVGGVGGARVLSQGAVEAMTHDQLTPEQRRGAEIFLGTHSGWGFGMAVNVQATGEPWVVPGRFGWDGGYGTTAYSDPNNDLVGILLTQRLMDSPEGPAVFGEFWAGAYGAPAW